MLETPSSAVTTIVMVFAPSLRLIEPDAAPDATATPLTVRVASACRLSGVTVVEVTLLATEAV